MHWKLCTALSISTLTCSPPDAAAGDPAAGEVPLIEVFCNPNAHSTAFDAKVLVTVRTSDGVGIMAEASLEQLRAGVDAALEAAAAT